LNLDKRQTRCSEDFWRVIVVWFCLEAVIRIGIWCGFLWLKSVENVIACIFLALLGLIWLDFRILQIALDSMNEMQEYIDRRLDEKENRKK